MRIKLVLFVAIVILAFGNVTADMIYLDTDWDDGHAQGFTTTNSWTLGTAGNVPPPSSSGNYWYGANTGGMGASPPPDDLLTSATYTMGLNQVDLTLEFTQRYWMPINDDAGIIEISVNSGAFTCVPSPDVPDYDDVITSGTNSLTGFLAYTGTSANFFDPAFRSPPTIVDLSNFVSAGDDFAVRFRQADSFGLVQDGLVHRPHEDCIGYRDPGTHARGDFVFAGTWHVHPASQKVVLVDTCRPI